ncbi:MAG: hypothetical protein RR365_01140 [Bacteroides sp.]
MFRTMLTPLIASKYADEFFPKINGESWNGDSTFLATLRATIDEVDEDGVRVIAIDMRKENIFVDGSFAKMLENTIQISPGDLIVVSASDTVVNKIKECNADGGYVMDEKVTYFFRNYMNVVTYINRERKCAVIFVVNLDMSKWHLLQTIMPRYLPWYYVGLTADSPKTAILKSLKSARYEEYEQLIISAASKYDIDKAKNKCIMRDFITTAKNATYDAKMQELTSQLTQFDQYQERMRNLLDKISETRMYVLGAKYDKEQNSDCEISDYVACNKNINLVSVNRGELSLVVSTFLDSYSSDCVSTVIENPKSYLYSSSKQTPKEIKEFYSAAFLENKFKIRTCAGYKVSSNYAMCSQEITAGFCANRIPNPHIQYYSCLGAYNSKLNEKILNADFVGVLELLTQSAKSINWSDFGPAEHFACDISEGFETKKCCEFPDGMLLTPKEALMRVMDEKKNKEEKDNA